MCSIYFDGSYVFAAHDDNLSCGHSPIMFHLNRKQHFIHIDPTNNERDTPPVTVKSLCFTVKLINLKEQNIPST